VKKTILFVFSVFTLVAIAMPGDVYAMERIHHSFPWTDTQGAVRIAEMSFDRDFDLIERLRNIQRLPHEDRLSGYSRYIIGSPRVESVIESAREDMMQMRLAYDIVAYRLYSEFIQRNLYGYDLYLGATNFLNRQRIDSFVLSARQSLLTRGHTDNDVLLYLIAYVQNLNWAAPGLDQNPKFAFETIQDGGGGCLDLSILLISFLRSLGYDTILILFTEDVEVGHAMVGVRLPDTSVLPANISNHAYFDTHGRRYFVIESTAVLPIGVILEKYTHATPQIFTFSGYRNPLFPSPWAVEQVFAAISANLVPSALQWNYEQATTREEFAALANTFYEAVTGRIIVPTATFYDTVNVNVRKMATIGVLSGRGNNRFDPEGNISREEAAVMLARLAVAVGQPFTSATPGFVDFEEISSWARSYVGQVQAADVMGGTGGNRFAPRNPFTREQSIVTIMTMFELMGNIN
jgi:hypothetical protein